MKTLPVALLWLLLLLPALAQTPTPDLSPATPAASVLASPEASPQASPAASASPAPKGKTFKVEEQQIEVQDRYGRLYRLPPNTAWLGVKLATGEAQHCKGLKSYKEISAGGVDYPYKEDADWVTFPLTDGVAEAKFVIFAAASKNPVDYQLALLLGEGAEQRRIDFSEGSWSVGSGSAPSDVKTELVAPHTSNEKLAIYGFGILSLILLYVLYGRSLFARMLINKKYEVSSALGWSNLLVVLGLLSTAACLTGLWLWPRMLWNQTYWIYVVVIAGQLLGMLLVYLIGLMVTRR